MVAHVEACRVVGLIFIPLMVETLGVWSEESVPLRALAGCQDSDWGHPLPRPPGMFSNVWPYLSGGGTPLHGFRLSSGGRHYLKLFFIFMLYEFFIY